MNPERFVFVCLNLGQIGGYSFCLFFFGGEASCVCCWFLAFVVSVAFVVGGVLSVF